MTATSINELAKEVFDIEANSILRLKNSIGDNFDKAIELLYSCKGRVIITGMGKSGLIGKKIAATLSSTGTPSYFLHPAESTHGDSCIITRDDVIIAISNSGETKELSDILLYCKRFGIPLIAMTKNPQSSLGKNSDLLLVLPDDGEACPLGLAPTSSTTATIVMGDILAIDLMERKGFSETDYKQRHPGGKLGAILRKVSDLMHSGDEMPVVNEDTKMQEALLVMTSKMLGCVGVVNQAGELTGIVTDGDLRRWLSPSLMSEKISEVMTKNPKTIQPDALAIEALKIMNTTGRGITNLFVVEGKKPVGLIHIHDCLRAGVA